MKFDLIIVTYNSEKWIENFFDSLVKSQYALEEISVTVVDNHSQDSTLALLRRFEVRDAHRYGQFQIIINQENLGFGQGNNRGVKNTHNPYILFVNIDTQILPDTFVKLEEEILTSGQQVALWELRQLPYEHPKYYDILTHETSWSSGAAFVMKRAIYEEVGGFDEKIFMYGEDVDLSWRVRASGYKLKYCPHIPIVHYSYEQGTELKPTQHIYGSLYNTLLRYRYGNLGNVMIGHVLALLNVMRPKKCVYSRRNYIVAYLKEMRRIPHFVGWRIGRKKAQGFVPKFYKMQYENMREGAFYMCTLPQEEPLVSIVIRTCERPCVLKEAVQSCLNQTYHNIEIIIIEDGLPEAEEMLNETFDDQRIRYYATQEKVGRSTAGNLGMERAQGHYISFLDDDDLYYAEHIEVLVRALEDDTNKVAYALAEESKIIMHSKEPYTYTEKSRSVFYKQPYSQTELFYHNYIPIQCVLFERSLFLAYGGLDVSADALEDWDLWVRYACYTDFTYVPKVTSLYRVPYEAQASTQRQEALDAALAYMRQKHKNYEVVTSPGSIGEGIQDLLGNYQILKLKSIGKKVKNKYPKFFGILLKIKSGFKI